MAPAKRGVQTVPEAVGVFNDADTLQQAIDELQTHGFTRQHLSMLADAKTVEKKLGHIYKRVEELEDNPNVPRTFFISIDSIGSAEGGLIGAPLYIASCTAAAIITASGGTLLNTIIATIAAGTGGALIGSVFAKMLDKHHADYIQDQINHGGILLWVIFHDNRSKKQAIKILKKYSARDIHVHNIPVTSF
ncbi:MAG: hypothetical protein AB8B66_04515 [Rickettsiaceae bacterium]